MSRVTWIGGGIVAAALYGWSAAAPQPAVAYSSADPASRELVTYHSADQPTGPIVLTVIDPQTSALAVYHITRETGEIKLKSVRNFQLDLRLTNFNGGSPSPEEIQKMFDRQL